MIKKKQGFQGQKFIQLPSKVVRKCMDQPLVANLFAISIGYYPKAAYHYRERRHGANEHILIYCVDGKGEAVIEGEKFKITPSEYLIIPRRKSHAYWSDADNPWSIYWLHLRGKGAEVISEILFKRMREGKNGILITGELIRVFNNIYNNFLLGYSTANMIYTSMNLNHYCKFFVYPEKIQDYNKKEGNMDFERVIRFLKENISKNISLHEIASVANLSSAHFCISFRKTTGFSPIEYFNHLKIQEACQLLQFTTQRISEIADAVGIEDPYYFSRLFHKIMGVSPKEYRHKKEFNDKKPRREAGKRPWKSLS
jgi:AraC-like DNA-binding protein